MATKVIDKMVTEGDLYSNISIICKGVGSLKAPLGRYGLSKAIQIDLLRP